MTEADLGQIEREAGFPLPEAYRAVALSLSSIEVDRSVKGMLCEDPRAVVGDLSDEERGEPKGWRRGFLAIGLDAAANTYVLDTTSDGLPVLLLSHETNELEPDWPTFDEFVREWRELPERIRIELDARRQAERAEVAARMRRAWKIIGMGTLVVIVLPMAALAVIVWFNERRRARRIGKRPVP